MVVASLHLASTFLASKWTRICEYIGLLSLFQLFFAATCIPPFPRFLYLYYSLGFPSRPHVLLCIFQSLVCYCLYCGLFRSPCLPSPFFFLRISVFHKGPSHPICSLLLPSVVVSFELNHKILLYCGIGPFPFPSTLHTYIPGTSLAKGHLS